jgi:hypothetical protein
VSEARKRWTDEQTILSELERLNDESESKAREYAHAAQAAAEAEAVHKSLRAQTLLHARARQAKPSAVEAEAYADADPEVADAYLKRLTATAVADAIKQALLTIRTNQDSLRTAVASHRQMFQGPGY